MRHDPLWKEEVSHQVFVFAGYEPSNAQPFDLTLR